MAKLMSRKTRETTLTIAVVVIAVVVIFFYIIYPLLKVPGMTARPNGSPFEDPAFRLLNDPASFVQAGLFPDSFTVSSSDNLFLAALRFKPSGQESLPKGTIILIHPDDTDRTYFIPYLPVLLDSGWAVVLYDQRASGLSGGEYHYAGGYEADDLVEMVSYLNIHDILPPPVIAVGFELGADAAITAAGKDKRISSVVAVMPHLSSSRWIEAVRLKQKTLWIPFHQIVYFWWYQKVSGYPFDRSGADDIQAIAAPAVILADEKLRSSDEWKAIKGESRPDFLSLHNLPSDQNLLREQVTEAIFRSIPK